jgi:hypothetical protein
MINSISSYSREVKFIPTLDRFSLPGSLLYCTYSCKISTNSFVQHSGIHVWLKRFYLRPPVRYKNAALSYREDRKARLRLTKTYEGRLLWATHLQSNAERNPDRNVLHQVQLRRKTQNSLLVDFYLVSLLQ